jgi:hypothetical protein
MHPTGPPGTPRAESPPSDRVYRPLGLILAILAVALLYGVMPLLEVYFLRRINAVSEETFILGGVDIGTWTLLEGAYGGVVLVMCILAWWGRPSWIRFVFMAAVLFPAAVMLYRVIQTWIAPADPISGGQAQEISQGLLRCQLPGLILVPLYVVWYINRAPARAFYRRVPLAALAPDGPGDGATDSAPGSDASTGAR